MSHRALFRSSLFFWHAYATSHTVIGMPMPCGTYVRSLPSDIYARLKAKRGAAPFCAKLEVKHDAAPSDLTQCTNNTQVRHVMGLQQVVRFALLETSCGPRLGV